MKHQTKAAEFLNNRSALQNYDFVTESIQELVRTHRVVEVLNKPKVINLLSVSSNKGKFILDLRYVNNHVGKNKLSSKSGKPFPIFIKGLTSL